MYDGRNLIIVGLSIALLVFIWLAWRNAQPMDCINSEYRNGNLWCEVNGY